MVRSRDPGRRHIRIQDRDIAVLAEIATAPAITIEHLAALYFRNRATAAYRRIGILRRTGIIRLTRPWGRGAPAILDLTRSGERLLAEHGFQLDRAPRTRRRAATIEHDLAIEDVRVAFVKSWGIRVTYFTADTLAVMDRQWAGRVRPDGYLAVQRGARTHHFCLEVDRSTETHAKIRSKIALYRALRRRGAFREGAPFRVLFVCRSTARRDNLAALALSLTPPVLSQCWFATLDDVKADPHAAIWLTAYALREARRTGSQFPRLQPLIE